MKKLCPHCDPYEANPAHVLEKVEMLFTPLESAFRVLGNAIQRFPRLDALFHRIFFRAFFKLLLAFRLLKEGEVREHEEEGFPSRVLVIIKEAKNRGIPIKAMKLFGRSTKFFSIQIGNTKRIFENLPHLEIGQVIPLEFDDKGMLKGLFGKEHIPYAKGGVFRKFSDAFAYVKDTVGFPVVVKPRFGSLSKHTTCNIATEDELKEAISVVKKISREFVVEEHIAGNVYRITLVDKNIVACCLREPPNVSGDGVHTIRELIEIKNRHPLRGELHQKNFTLHKIAITGKTDALLERLELTLESVLPYGQKVYVHDKVILGCGADIHDVTALMHRENIALFQKLASLCTLPIIGIDFIAPDIEKPYYEKRCAVIEINTVPYIDMHHFPVCGVPRNVAASVLDFYTTLHSVL